MSETLLNNAGSAPVPRHVAIIMDGNGRWAQRRGRPRVYGHIRGSSRIKEIVRVSREAGVEALTLYAFSTENWNRPESERSVLWKLLRKFLKKEIEELARNQVQLQVIGEWDRLDAETRACVEQSIDRLRSNTGLKLTFALSYGSRKEILRATQLFSQDCLRGVRKPEELTEAVFEEYLWTAPLRDLSQVDLVIRTSGEQRISNFLLWQAAYAEFVFLDLCWPDFTPENFKQSLREFSARDRRFGKVRSEAPALNSLTQLEASKNH